MGGADVGIPLWCGADVGIPPLTEGPLPSAVSESQWVSLSDCFHYDQFSPPPPPSCLLVTLQGALGRWKVRWRGHGTGEQDSRKLIFTLFSGGSTPRCLLPRKPHGGLIWEEDFPGKGLWQQPSVTPGRMQRGCVDSNLEI